MSLFMFGQGPGHLADDARRVAKKHGADLVNYTGPDCKCGHGCKPNECPASRSHWFMATGRGEPFDRRRADKVAVALKEAGIK